MFLLLRSLLLIPVATATVLLDASAARATVLYVDASCGDDAKPGTSPNCPDANGPKLTIQNAINTAVDTDEIVVSQGTYNEAINFLGKAITLRSTDPSDPAVVAATIIDGTDLNDSVVKCVSGEGADTVLHGFIIAGGAGTDLGGYTVGGGLYNSGSSPTVTHCTFTENSASSHGGGMYNYNYSSPTVTDCTFTGNTGTNAGGGMYNADSSPTVTNCAFSGNSGGYGGGMYSSYSSRTVTNSTFIANRADVGGGMYNYKSNATVANCTFSGNRGRVGGGMYNDHSDPTVTTCTFNGNTASEDAGGMHNYFAGPTVANCTFNGNTASRDAGAMYNDFYSSLTVISCSFAGNSAGSHGGGMFNCCQSSSTVTNAILWDNMDSMGTSEEAQLYVYKNGTSSLVVAYSSIQDDDPDDGLVYPGTGNIDADPLFVRDPNDGGDGWGDDPDTTEIDEGANDDFGDLRLQSGSLCINAGDPGFIPGPGETDLDGHTRVLCGRVDMGAYEFGIGDYDCNDAVDLLDFSMWAACMTGPDGEPYGDACEAFDFDGENDVDMADFALFVASFESS